MSNIIKGKIALNKLAKAKVLKKDGRTFIEITNSGLFEGKNGDIYLDFTCLVARESKYGETHFIVQDLRKEAREAGEKGPILGNATEQGPKPTAPTAGDAPPANTRKPRPTPAPQNEDLDEDVPF